VDWSSEIPAAGKAPIIHHPSIDDPRAVVQF
jgi:hypothetical protein